MGANTSQLTKIANSILNESVTNILQRNEANSTFSIQAGQSANLVIKNSTVNCTDNPSTPLIQQTMTGEITIATSITQQSTSDIKTLFDNASDSNSEQFQKVLSETLGGIGTTTEQNTDISNAIKNVIKTNVTQENLTSIVQNFSFNQAGNVEIINTQYTGPCSFNQNLALHLQASSIIGNVVSAIANNQTVNEVVSKVTQKQEVELKGLADIVRSVGDAVSSVFASLTAPMIIAIIAGAILLFMGFPIGVGSLSGGTTKDKDGKEVHKSGWKAGLLTFLFLLLLTAGIIGILYWKKKWPFSETLAYPPDVVAQKCESEYDAVKPVKAKYNEASTQTEVDKILMENKGALEAYDLCMKKANEKGNEKVKVAETFKRTITIPDTKQEFVVIV